MQNPLTFDSHNWLGYVLAAVIGLLGGKGPDWYSAWQNRKKPKAEIDLTDAQAELARAQARKEDKETIADIMRLLKEAALESEKARNKLDTAERELKEAKAREAKYRGLVAVIRLKQYMNESELSKYLDGE